jgi:acetyl-CoA carboxylase beta subunit
MKLTKEQINEIKKLKEEKSNKEISEIIGCSINQIVYHTNEIQKSKSIKRAIKSFKNKSKEQRKEIYIKRKPYQKNYYKDRYANDPIFREKIKKYMRERQRKNG